MFDGGSALYEDLLALEREWQKALDELRRVASGLLSPGLVGGGRSPIADRQRSSDLGKALGETVRLRKCLDDLDELLAAHTVVAVLEEPARPLGVIHTSPVKGDDGGEPF